MTHVDRDKQAADAVRYTEHDPNVCQCCLAHGPDKRSLRIDCFYDIAEVVPEFIALRAIYGLDDTQSSMFYMRICKSCRGRLLSALAIWFKDGVDRRDQVKDEDGTLAPISNDLIPVREFGVTRWLTMAQWRNYARQGQRDMVS